MRAIAKKLRQNFLIRTIQTFLFLIVFTSFSQSPPESGSCGRTFLDFDGLNDYLDVQGSTIDGAGGTWEAWVRKEDWLLETNGILFGNDIAFNSANTMYLSFHSAVGLHFRYGDNGNEPSTGGAIFGQFTNGFTPNSWHHVAVTWAHVSGTTTLKIFVDGVEQVGFSAGSRPTHNTLIDPGESLNFGFSQGENYLEAGSMAEIRTWDVARTETEIANGMNSVLTGSEVGLTGYWPLNNPEGSTSLNNLVSGAPSATLTNFDASTAWDNQETSLQLSVSETGLANGGTYDFSFVEVAQTETQTFTLTNNTASTITFSGSPIVTLTGVDAGLFSIDQSPLTSTLASGNQMNFDISFTPSTTGNFTAAIAFQSDETCGNASYSLTLDGAGEVLPSITSHDRAIIYEGETDVTNVDAIDNNGGATDQGMIYSLTGDDASLFQIDAGGSLSFVSAPSFENPQDVGADQTYELNIIATSALGRLTQIFTVEVFESVGGVFTFNETPETVSGINATFIGGVIAQGRLSIPFNGSTTVQFDQAINISNIELGDGGVLYSINPVGGSSTNVTANGNSGRILVELDYKEVEAITIEQIGGFGSPDLYELYFSILLPTFSSNDKVQFIENSTGSVIDVNALAPGESTEDTHITYAIDQSYDGSLFSISVNGEVSFLGVPSFENPLDGDGDNIYEVLVEATIGLGTRSQLLIIEVMDENDAPVLEMVGDRLINIGRSLTFVAGISDEDVGQNLAVSLDAASISKGMTIDESGNFSWTPVLTDIGSHTVTLAITDDGIGNLTDLEIFTVDVFAANEFPVLDAIGDQSIDEETTLSFMATATDVDMPGQNLSFSLDATSMASGMTLSTSGDFTWSPTETQNGDHVVKVTVADDGPGSLTNQETLIITVNEVNLAPVLSAIDNQTLDELTELTLTASATDTDLPANNLLYSLDASSSSKGMTIDSSTGAFSWTPSESQDGNHMVTFTVQDDGSGSLTDTETITITVNETNEPPRFQNTDDQIIDEETELRLSLRTFDLDQEVKGQSLTFTLDPTSLGKGMVLDDFLQIFGNAIIYLEWTPSEFQDGDHTVTINADDGAGGTDDLTVTITVNDVNEAPILTAIGEQSINEESTLSFTAVANDTDNPSNTVSFSLDANSLTKGMLIGDVAGSFSWTPTEAQSGDHEVTVTGTDDGEGTLSASETITITVNELNEAPILDAIGDKSVDEGDPLTFTTNATDVDLPANTLAFTLDAASQAKGMSIGEVTGVFAWTPSESQDGDHTVTFTVTDDGTGTLSDEETITITVNEVNLPPVLDLIGDQSVDELQELTFSMSAFDSDVPEQILTYFFISGFETGMTLTPSGDFSWTPTEAQDGSYEVWLTAADGNIPLPGNDDEIITITVNEVNNAPVLLAIGDQTSDEESILSFTVMATDSDAPLNTLTFSLDATSLGKGMSIDSETGAFSWTPSEEQDGDHTVTISVTDDGAGYLSDAKAITITVNEVNVPPVLIEIGGRTVDELGQLNFTAIATDSDVPLNTTNFSLDATAIGKGMTIDASTGEFNWTPSEDQDGDHMVTITIMDDGNGSLTDSETFMITVNEVNLSPVLDPVFDQSASTDELLTLNITGSDADLPANTLTYSLDAISIGKGMSIGTSTGTFNWTPDGDDSGTANSVTVTLSDGTLTDDVSFVIGVDKEDQAITFGTLTNKTFGDPDFDLTVTASSSLIVTFVSSDEEVATVSGSTVTLVGAGSTTITASQSGNGNFNAAEDVSQTLIVNKANQIISFNDLAAVAFGDVPFALSATVSSGLDLNYESSDKTIATVSNGTVTIVGAGTATISASQPGNDNYDAANAVSQTLTVNKAGQTITFGALANKTFGNTDFALSAITSSGLNISYISSDTEVATLSGEKVTVVGAGSTVIAASQLGNDNYEAAISVTQTLAVGKASLEVTAVDQVRIYNEINPVLTLSYGGFIGGASETDLDTKPTVSTAADVLSDVGSYAITVSGGSDKNYDFLYKEGTLRVNQAEAIIILSDLEQEVDGTAKSPTVITDPEGLNFSISYDGVAEGPTEEGSYEVKITIDELNYQGETTETLVITPSEQPLSLELGQDFSIYPNPTNDLLTINGKAGMTIELVDMMGVTKLKKEMESSTIKLTLLDFVPGIYIIQLSSEKLKRVSQERFLIRH